MNKYESVVIINPNVEENGLKVGYITDTGYINTKNFKLLKNKYIFF